MSTFKQVFEVDSKVSSKRVLAVVSFIVAVVIAFLPDMQPQLYAMLAFSGSCLGITGIEKFKK